MKPRSRLAGGESVQEWLLSEKDRAACKFGLPGTQIQCSLLQAKEFDATIPPKIPSTFSENFTLGPRSNPISIRAPMHLVWREILDFEAYSEYNPFHRKVDVLARGTNDGPRFLSMRVNLMGAKRDLLLPPQTYAAGAPERIFYVDERDNACILLYGLQGPISTIRGQVLVKTGANTCDYYSYDQFGGLLHPIVNWTLSGKIQTGFELAADALKRRCEQMAKL